MAYASADGLWNSREAGALWENYVIAQWVRRRDWHEPSLMLWAWRDQTGNEVDLLSLIRTAFVSLDSAMVYM